MLKYPYGKLNTTFFGSVNTTGPAKNFSHLQVLPFVYPPHKRMTKTSKCVIISKLIWWKLQN